MAHTDSEPDRLNAEFDKMLVGMKPLIYQFTKSERNRCAQWIKKLSEHPISNTARKNRNAYGQLLLHMMKNQKLEGPFISMPEPGLLPTLPAYMDYYYDDRKLGSESDNQSNVPDWVRRELSTGSASSVSPSSPLKLNLDDRFNSALGHAARPKSPSRMLSSFPSASDSTVPPLNFDPIARPIYPPSDEDDTTTTTAHFDDLSHQFRRDHRNHTDSTASYPQRAYKGGGDHMSSLFRDESTFRKSSDREMNWIQRSDYQDLFPVKFCIKMAEMKSKMYEARLEDEKMKLNQKHDRKVEEILQRKNGEIEDLKNHYRSKTREQEDALQKYERKVSLLQKELADVKDSRDQQVEDLKRATQQSSHSYQTDIEKKVHEVRVAYEQEKYDLQQQHTKDIQSLRDDTNQHLHNMEEEHNRHAQAMCAQICELESRVQQLSAEVESSTRQRMELEKQRSELEGRAERLQADLHDIQAKHSVLEKENKNMKTDHEQEIRALKNKHEADVEFLKQEKNLQAVKSADNMSELEQHLSKLKQALDAADLDKQKSLREAEENKQTDLSHLEQLHAKKVRSLQADLENLQEDTRKRVRKLEQTIREKDEEMSRQARQHEEHNQQAEQALDDFKQQVNANSSKMYIEMKQQMDKVSQDLNRSKQLREKQAKEFQKQMDTEQQRQQQQLHEAHQQHESEKKKLLGEFQQQKALWQASKDHELARLRDSFQNDMADAEQQARAQAETDAKTISDLEESASELRDEILKANQLRKQQLVELSLLREEEKQKMQREYEEQFGRFKSHQEQQRLELEKKHSIEMEKVLDKSNSRLKEIEKDYSERNTKSNETITELERALGEVREAMSRREKEAAQQLHDTQQRSDTERTQLRQQHSHALMTLQQEVENGKSKLRQTERKMAAAEHDHDEAITSLKTKYEEKLRGLIPISVRQELEDTIRSLRSQVTSLHQRLAVLQSTPTPQSPHRSKVNNGHAHSTPSFTGTIDSPRSGRSESSVRE